MKPQVYMVMTYHVEVIIKAPKTVKQYISHVKSLNVDPDLPFDACRSVILQHLIRGIKRYHGEKDRNAKLPITINILRKRSLHSAAAGNSRLTARRNSTRPGTSPDAPSSSFPMSPPKPTSSYLFHPPNRPLPQESSIVVAAAPGTSTCPVAALHYLFEAHPTGVNSPLFVGEDGQTLTRTSFIARDAGEAILTAFTLTFLENEFSSSPTVSSGSNVPLTLSNLPFFLSLLAWLEFVPIRTTSPPASVYRNYADDDPICEAYESHPNHCNFDWLSSFIKCLGGNIEAQEDYQEEVILELSNRLRWENAVREEQSNEGDTTSRFICLRRVSSQ
ncbi:hypothetical protein M422DRAFT_260309 [Sphaerobolus stellatus SS14]|uniref:Uncharacterized protein n=1 Tax=Sphaerobolus stellatus (strain SS14) TaxID=990650 RepID=A0A0C9U2S2_SPHS4|nr:hypothetical protein M422DRAFT_260309 [Sphaerobolus stellatus SS14]